MNSTLFANAHRIAKYTAKFVGNYSIAFSIALKNEYKKFKTYTALTTSNCQVWAKAGFERIYFNNQKHFDAIFNAFKLKPTQDDLDVLNNASSSKTWFDFQTSTFCSKTDRINKLFNKLGLN